MFFGFYLDKVRRLMFFVGERGFGVDATFLGFTFVGRGGFIATCRVFGPIKSGGGNFSFDRVIGGNRGIIFTFNICI